MDRKEGVSVFFAYLPTDAGPDFYTNFYATLPLPIQQQLNRYYREQDRLAGIIGKNLLRYGLRKLGLEATALEAMQYTATNRPYLAHDPWVDFNLSHSESLVVCAISVVARVGVDVEKEKAISLVNFQASFSGRQWETLESSAHPQKLFYQLWVQKEALVKADGSGLGVPFAEIDMMENTSLLQQDRWFLTRLEIDPLYCSWLACSKKVAVTTEQVVF